MAVNVNNLNPIRSIYSLIGILCKDPSLIRRSEYVLDKNDFYQDLHKIIFGSIHNIVTSTSKEIDFIDAIDIENYLGQYPKLYTIWTQQKGLEYVNSAIDNANESMFEVNYNTVKKFSLLRHFYSQGFSVEELFPITTDNPDVINKAMVELEKIEVEDIIEHFTRKMIETRESFALATKSKDFKAGDDIDELIENINEAPEYGYPFMNPVYNAVFRGKRPGKFLLRSAGTGAGKTRQAIADCIMLSSEVLYNVDTNRYERNGPAIPTCYISTEINKREVQLIMLAVISGVPEEIIKDGDWTPSIRERIQYAAQALKRAPIFCTHIEDFSISDIEMKIEEQIINNDIKMASFDYIQITPKLARTSAKLFGTSLREDQILVYFSAALKALAEKYQIFMESSTQLNRASKDVNMRDTSSLRGGSAVADKVDHGLQAYKVTEQDRNNLKSILETGIYKTPNYSHWVYKNRSGLSEIIIWTRMNLSNMREEICFVTDYDYNLIDVKQVVLDFPEE